MDQILHRQESSLQDQQYTGNGPGSAPLPSSRRPFNRESSSSSLSPEEQTYQASHLDYNSVGTQHHGRSVGPNAFGLGLRDIPEEVDRIRRVPVGSKDNLRRMQTASTPELTAISSSHQGDFSEATTANNTPADKTDTGDPYRPKWPTPQASHQSLPGSVSESAADIGFQHVPTDGALLQHEYGEHHHPGCPTHGDVLKPRLNWFTITIILLALYSTIFSAVFLLVAFIKPRWGHRIGTQTGMSFSDATLLSAFFSKTVELAFATVAVATLGQWLTRQAFIDRSKSRARGSGISIAQMNMRLWIMQPGTLITNWIGVRYALPTVLGLTTLLATITTVLYTTACEGLVAPKLKMGNYEERALRGPVSASYANSGFLSLSCQTPISKTMEPSQIDRGGTCLQLQHAGQSFHNFDSWITEWARQISDANFNSRLAPLAIMFDNTTVRGQWITPSNENITADSQKWGRFVQNVTMAMPHSNLFNAVRDPYNEILQPEDLRGSGEYIVQAAIPVPAINVLCAGLSTAELAPMVVDNTTKSVSRRGFNTTVDKLFGWSSNGKEGEFPPWFAKAPKEFNTVVNFTTNWGPSGIYIVAKPPNTTVTNDYILCSMRSMQYPNCTTSYHVANSGGNLTVNCDSDPGNVLPYLKVNSSAPTNRLEYNWKDVAVEWVRAVALTHGVNDGDAAIARILTQMIPTYSNETPTKLKPTLPSYGEGLAVLSGFTLLLSSSAAPFTHEWNWLPESPYYLEKPQYEFFQARLVYKDYASGGVQDYQNVFYIILIFTFVLSLLCTAYLLWHFCRDGYVTDYTEPQNMFALAVNSPPSDFLAGACGAGPKGSMLARKWCVNMSRQTPTAADAHSPSWPLNRQSTVNMSMSPAQSHPHFYLRSTDQEYVAGAKSQLTPQHPYLSPGTDPSSPPWIRTPDDYDAERSRFLSKSFGSGSGRPKTWTPNTTTATGGSRGIKDVLRRSKSKIQHSSDRVRFSAPLSTMTGRKSLPKLKSMDDLRGVKYMEIDDSPAVQQYLRLTGKG